MTAAWMDDDNGLLALRHAQDATPDQALDEYDAAVDLDTELPPLPSIDEERQAVRFLAAYKLRSAEAQRTDAAYAAEIDRLQQARKAEAERADRSLAWLSQALHGFYQRAGAKRIVLPHGTLSLRKQPAHVVIADPDSFCALHAGTQWVRVKTEPDKQVIRQVIAATGDIPEGADLDRPEPRFVIALK